MPRNGSGVASKPAGTTAVPNTTVESAKYNSTIDDIYALLNDPLPTTAGGTGANTAAGARTALEVPGLTTNNSMSGINTHTKIVKWAKGADVASATTLTLGDDGNYFDITGTTTVTSIATKGVGTRVLLQFDAALTLTHSAADLVLPTGANITTAAGDHFEFVEYATGDWRCTGYSLANGRALTVSAPTSGEFFRGHITGLTLSNNVSDASNDIDIATGSAGSDGATSVLMTLASGITKRIDAAWAVGTNQGGLDTGSVTLNTYYYVWLIRRSDTGVVDVLLSASATSPTMPTSYDQKRRIGWLLTNASSQIIGFVQQGDEFLYKVPITGYNNSNPGTSAVVTGLDVPPIPVTAIYSLTVRDGSPAAGTFILITATTQTDTAPTSSLYDMRLDDAVTSIATTHRRTPTTTRQVRFRLSNSDAGIQALVLTHGCVDDRGRYGGI